MTKVDIKAELNSFSLGKRKEIEHYILHDRTNNGKKVAGIIASLPIYQNLKYASARSTLPLTW